MEFDIQPTLDGTPVLFHDDTLAWLTKGRGRVDRSDLPGVQALDVGQWFSEDFTGERIPTLDQALDLLVRSTDWTGLLFAELKGPVPEGFGSLVAEAIAARGLSHRTVLISLDWQALETIRILHPGFRVGFVVARYQNWREAVAHCRARSGDILDPDYRLLIEDPDLAREAQVHGLSLACWTVDEPADATRLAKLGVQDFTSNRVDRLLRWRAQYLASEPGVA